MKPKPIGLSERYVTALRKHLRQGPRASLRPARSLGRQAVALGLKALELARMHERAFAALELTHGRNGLSQRAEIFFSEALKPIVETRRAARRSQLDLNRRNDTLTRRTLELVTTNRQLRRRLVRRKRVEGALKLSGLHYRKLLRDSLDLQEGLRELTHRNLSAQETERQMISHQLQDEIAQTLLGINVRLLTLKRAARGNASHLTKEIASTQRLVEESVKSIHRFARELDTQPPG